MNESWECWYVAYIMYTSNPEWFSDIEYYEMQHISEICDIWLCAMRLQGRCKKGPPLCVMVYAWDAMLSVVTLFYIMLDGLVFLSFFLAILVRHSCSLFYVPGKLISICQLDISYYLFGSNNHSIDFFHYYNM